jgi:hypothetical protein
MTCKNPRESPHKLQFSKRQVEFLFEPWGEISPQNQAPQNQVSDLAFFTRQDNPDFVVADVDVDE